MKLILDLEEIKYIKITIPTDKENSITVRAAIKNINEREIIACTKYDTNINPNAPLEIVLSIVADDGIYRTKTCLKSFEHDGPYTFMYLETPDNIEYQQNREYFRVPMVCECNYKVIANGEKLEFNAKTVDISANGVSIYSPELFISSTDNELIININGRKVQTKARYIRSERFGDAYRISFAYTNITESDRDVISQACLAKQLEEKRNKLV